MEKSRQIFTIIEYQKKAVNLLSEILIDSVFRTGKNYYPQVFLEKKNTGSTQIYVTEILMNSLKLNPI